MKAKQKFGAFLVACLLSASAFASAEAKAETTFTDGSVSRKDAKGKLVGLEIGDKLQTGESVITGKASSAELKLLSGSSSIKIRQNSVFTLGEKNVGGEKQTVLQTVVGSAAMKFEKLGAKEPLVGTASCVAGVRGTEVEILAAMDGSSVIAVRSGAVQLESGGASVDLAENEAVEVKPGQAPGSKFAWIGKELDFSAWDKGKLASYLADPVGSALELAKQLADYRASMNALLPELAKQKAAYDEAYAELDALVKAKDDAKAQELRESTVFPLMQAQGNLILNIRYYALTSLSLRRYVLGGMYMELKTRHPKGPGDPAFAPFLEAYQRILDDFEKGIAPQLVEADI
jgi:hypothetical protein